MNKRELIKVLDLLQEQGWFQYPYNLVTDVRDFNLWIDGILGDLNAEDETNDWDK